MLKAHITKANAEKLENLVFPETMKYWVGVQQGQSYLMGRMGLFSLGWLPF